MKFIKTSCLVLALLVLFTHCSKTNTAVPQQFLIAHYPLINDGVDLTGLNAPMNLVHAPFQNGGVYCNGKYSFSSDTDFCIVQTPSINSFNANSFSISMDFMVSEKRTQPVWIIGSSCRWIGFYLYEDGTVALLYNNWDFLTTKTGYSLNAWHQAKISFDGTTASIFLDSALAGSLKFGNGYVPLNSGTCGTSDNDIGVTNFSNGAVLNGYVKNLEVYCPH